MGGMMAHRLLAAGYPLSGTARTREHLDALLAEGLRWCDTPRAVAEVAEIVFTSLPDDDALNAVASAADGILAGLANHAIWVEMSTVSPRPTRRGDNRRCPFCELAFLVRGRGLDVTDGNRWLATLEQSCRARLGSSPDVPLARRLRPVTYMKEYSSG
jgi:hypothetical protein